MQTLEFPASVRKEDPEFNASETRKILQELFPTRKLVLSQFTFFNQVGVSKPSGDSFRRGRRCYKAQDLLPIAVVLALKEQGIPNKNIASVPEIIQENSARIFESGSGTRISGFRDTISLNFVNENSEDHALNAMLACDVVDHTIQNLFWSYDVGSLAQDINQIVRKYFLQDQIVENAPLRAVA